MKFELAIATMNKNEDEVLSMIKQMNVKCNCLVIVQCDQENNTVIHINEQKIRIIYTKERGLSRSRNMAIMNSEADIMGIADDDLNYYDNFDELIVDYYISNKHADIVLFNIDDYSKKFPNKNYKCGFFELSGFISMQVTVRTSSLKSKNMKFNEYFGTGSSYVNSGEENVFLADNYRAGNKIFYCKNKILKRQETQSSWFISFNEEKFISSRGSIYYAMTKHFCLLYIIRFAFKYHKNIRPITITSAVKLMFLGIKRYKSYLKTLLV